LSNTFCFTAASRLKGKKRLTLKVKAGKVISTGLLPIVLWLCDALMLSELNLKVFVYAIFD
jgi:hypothetical protein